MSYEVDLSVHVEASPATVFEYFVDPTRLCRWMGSAATLDPRPGGGFRIDVAEQAIAVGTYVEVTPPQRVVFTWGWDGNDGLPPGSTTVEVTLTPAGDGTSVRLRHYDLPTEEAVDHHGVGWNHYLVRLQLAAPGGDPGPDRPPGSH